MNTKTQNKSYLLRQIKLIVTMFVLVLTIVFSFDTFVAAARENTSDMGEATPGDAEPEIGDGLHYDENAGVWYLYKNNSKVTTTGWVTVNNGLIVNIGNSGVVTEKLESNGSVKKLYKCSGDNWVMQKNIWKTISGNKYYFAASGICARIYYAGSRKLYIYSNGTMVPAKNTAYSLDDKKLYLFNENGIRVTRNGWYEANSALTYYVSGSGYITHRLLKSGSNYTYAHYNYNNNTWVNEKDCWKTFLGKTYYFSKSGICTRLYNSKNNRLYVYSGNKLVPAKNNIYKLQGSRYYFFNGSGVKVTKAGWKKIDSNNYVYVAKSGYVTLKYKKSGGLRKLYQYNAKKGSWDVKKNTWQTIAGATYKFNSKGTAVIMYNKKTKKCYDFSNRKWKLVKNQTRKIDGKTYFFNGKGKRVTTAGSYKTSDGYIAYVNNKGIVTKTELDLSVSRYYTINLGGGKKTKVYGHYDLAASEAIVREINKYREERHESQLVTNASITNIANIRAREISNTYGHTRPNGTLCIDSFAELYGENIACGFEYVDDVMWAWKRSQGHSENMLRSDYRYVGVAVFVAERNDNQGFTYYYVQAFGK
ncbi:MAG: CAP domain-containing protein [Coprococcus sp.]